MAISALDKETVKLVTATQVITSVSSAVKELIENALDAHAKNIEINLTDNGCSLIEVKDDGCGISKDDAYYMALSSHTSKIVNFSDLDSLETYGFRGEALFALSSVSDLTIISRTGQDEVALSYKIDHYGCIEKSETCHRPIGTTVQVKQLFKQIPVRRQLIANPKKANQDIKTLESLIKSYAMCKFLSRISYRLNNNVVFVKPSMGTLEEAVTYVLGRKVTSNMKWIDIANPKIKIMVPCKKMQNVLEVFQHGAQYIFINNRPIKHKELEKTLTRIILEGLGLEMLKKKPIFIVSILINSADIDVNLEPNKTTVLLKEQHIVVNAIEDRLKNFYNIHREERQQEDNHDNSFSAYQDYTEKCISTVEDERPACKKRKLETEECVVKHIDKNVQSDKLAVQNLDSAKANFNRSEQSQLFTTERYADERLKRCEETDGGFNVLQLPMNLSDPDSNDSQTFKLTYNDKDISHSSLEEATKENIKGSPPFELTPGSESFSQLPIVDLGEDFDLADASNVHRGEKENQRQNTHLGISHEEQRLKKASITLKEWSKGYVSGIKGGTDIQVHNYAPSNEVSGDVVYINMCAGFRKYSDVVMAHVEEKNPSYTAPQIAHTITKLWKKLSPQERGYYRDIARNEKSECDSESLSTKQTHESDVKKNKNRLLTALEKMKTMNVKKEGNLVMRSTIHWNVDLKKVKESLLNNFPSKNNNCVVGLLCPNLWIVHKSAHIWIMDTRNLKKELHISHADTSKNNVDNIEQLLQQWHSIGNDLSLLHHIHSLSLNE